MSDFKGQNVSHDTSTRDNQTVDDGVKMSDLGKSLI